MTIKSKLLFLAAALSSVVSLPAKENSGPIRLAIDVDRDVLPANSTERAVIKVGLDCLRPPRREDRAPVNLALVIDRSGSMEGAKIAKAREAALELVRRLAPDDVVSLIAYDSNVQVLVSAQRVGDGRALERAISGIEAGGSTALYGGVTRGADEVRRYLGELKHVPRVILLSDGQANVGPSSPEELGRLGASLMKEGIPVTTIGLGLGFNEDLMTRLAQRSDGNTYFVESSDDLPRIFAAELGDVLNVVARRVVIHIDFPEGVRPVQFVGRDGVIRERSAELTLNQVYGGQEKFALIEVEVKPTRPGTEQEIARAKLSYEDAASNKAASTTAVRSIKFSTDTKVVVASANHQVQADFAMNSLALAKDEAVKLADAGRRDEAAAVVRNKAKELKSLGATYANEAVSAAAAPAAIEADRLEREGLSNAQRKAYVTDSANVKSQQATSKDKR